MSNPEVQRVIGRAFIDEEFRKQCFTNWDNICDSMNISDDAERKQAAEFLKRIVSFWFTKKRYANTTTATTTRNSNRCW